MARQQIKPLQRRQNPEVEERVLGSLRRIHENFGPFVSVADGDLRVEWPKDRRSWTMAAAGIPFSVRASLQRRGYIDEFRVWGIASENITPRFRITVEGLIAIGAYPKELTGQTDGNEAEEGRGKERKETKRKTGFVEAVDLHPSF